MKDKKITTIEGLARMVNDGFEEARKDRNKIKNKLEKMDDRLGNMDARLATMQTDIKGFVSQDDFEDLMARVKTIELQLGIESGK